MTSGESVDDEILINDDEEEEDENAYFSNEKDEINDYVHNEDYGMPHFARSHGADRGNEPPYGSPYSFPTGCESYGSIQLPLEFDYSSNQFRIVGENYQLFVCTTLINDFTTPSTGKGLNKGSKRIVQTAIKIKKDENHFDKERGYDNTERAKRNLLEGMDPDAWVRVIEELFTNPTKQK
ncbi:hypothetical protein R6Q57_002020 [Mikania cordata]